MQISLLNTEQTSFSIIKCRSADDCIANRLIGFYFLTRHQMERLHCSMKVREVRRLPQVFHLLSSACLSADDLGPLDPSDCSWLHWLPQWPFCLLLTSPLWMLDFDLLFSTTFFFLLNKTKTKTRALKVPDYISESSTKLVFHILPTSPENSVFNPVFNTMFKPPASKCLGGKQTEGGVNTW